jgi:hypothetical protein
MTIIPFDIEVVEQAAEIIEGLAEDLRDSNTSRDGKWGDHSAWEDHQKWMKSVADLRALAKRMQGA